MNRRSFIKNTIATGLIADSSILLASTTQDIFVVDAMGEIRDAYSESLIKEMIDSGLNAITVTLCDPKSYELDAFDMAMTGIAEYDRIIVKHNGTYRPTPEPERAKHYVFQAEKVAALRTYDS